MAATSPNVCQNPSFRLTNLASQPNPRQPESPPTPALEPPGKLAMKKLNAISQPHLTIHSRSFVVVRKLYLAGLPRLQSVARAPHSRGSCLADESHTSSTYPLGTVADQTATG